MATMGFIVYDNVSLSLGVFASAQRADYMAEQLQMTSKRDETLTAYFHTANTQVGHSQVKTEQVKTEQVKTEQVKAEQPDLCPWDHVPAIAPDPCLNPSSLKQNPMKRELQSKAPYEPDIKRQRL
jgi:hypothetical protein